MENPIFFKVTNSPLNTTLGQNNEKIQASLQKLGDLNNYTEITKKKKLIHTNMRNTLASNKTILMTTIPYQCKRSACRKAESPSIISRMEIVNTAKKAKITKSTPAPTYPFHFNAIRITIPHSTSDNSAKTQIARQQTAISPWNKIKLCACACVTG